MKYQLIALFLVFSITGCLNTHKHPNGGNDFRQGGACISSGTSTDVPEERPKQTKLRVIQKRDSHLDEVF